MTKARRSKEPQWPGRKATERALFKPRVEKMWGSTEAVLWLADRARVDVAMSGMKIGDLPGGDSIAGSWEGIPIVRSELSPGVLLAKREDRYFHVRLEEGEPHDGHPDNCDKGVCLAERIMGG